MLQPGRKYSAGSSYRYGFNGKENDNEVKGIEGSQQDYGMRIYDPRLGKFLSKDPLMAEYPMFTVYQFASNSPISGIDLDGLEYESAVDWAYLNISDYDIVFTREDKDPPTFKTLRKSDWKTVIGDKMYCSTSTSLAYAQGNPRVSAYLARNGFETNRISGQFEFFQKRGAYHSLILPENFAKAKKGDLLFLQGSGTGPMTGHVALLATNPVKKDDPRVTEFYNDKMTEDSYMIDMLTTNAGSTLNPGSTDSDAFGYARYIIEKGEDNQYYLKYKYAIIVVKNEAGVITKTTVVEKDMRLEKLKVQGFGRVEEKKIDPKPSSSTPGTSAPGG
jgi:RHS repeat-associated protein